MGKKESESAEYFLVDDYSMYYITERYYADGPLSEQDLEEWGLDELDGKLIIKGHEVRVVVHVVEAK